MGVGTLPAGVDGNPYMRLFVSIGLIFIYILAFAVPSIFSSNSLRLSFSSILVSLLAVDALLDIVQPSVLSSYAMVSLSYVFQGICVGFAYAQMGAFLYLLKGRTAAISLAGAMSIAALGNLLLDLVNPSVVNFVLKAAIMASILLFLRIPLSKEKRVKPKRMFSEYPETRSLFSELFFISILYGFMVMFASVAVKAGLTESVTLGFAYLVPAIALLSVVILLHKQIDFLSLRWTIVPLITIVIVPLTIVPINDGMVFLAGVLALFQTLEASSALSLAESAREHDLPPISTFVLLRLVGTAGLFLGRAICLETTSYVDDFSYAFKVIVAAIIIILVIWRMMLANERKSGDSLEGSQMLNSPKNSEMESSSSWQGKRDEQLKKLASNHSLSERETEVFLLLAKGRNAAYIGGYLYISENTVRSHIQRIYTKLDTHSQQELLDFIDKASTA